jgi:hypothetical protein
MPRRRLYWIEAVYGDGVRQVVASFRDEAAALVRLRELQNRDESIEQRIRSRDSSRWHVAGN